MKVEENETDEVREKWGCRGKEMRVIIGGGKLLFGRIDAATPRHWLDISKDTGEREGKAA